MLAVQAVIGAFVAFGLEWDGNQVAAVVAATSAVLALVFDRDVTKPVG